MSHSMRSFTIKRDRAPAPGDGDMVSVTQLLPGRITLDLIRSSKRDDNRGRRSISVDLNRSEALALGRHLIGEASGLAVLDQPTSEFRIHTNAWNRDQTGRFMVSLAASLMGGEVVLSMGRYRFDGPGGKFDGDVAAIFDIEEMREFARSLLTACQG